jgi:biopolymer transport protein ExbD
VYGQRKDDIDNYIAGEAQASRLLVSKNNPNSNIQPGDELPTIVVIRADLSTTFKKLNRLIRTCQDNGFRHFAMKATNKEPDQ